MKQFSVIIIGAGSTGLSTALHLAQKGVQNVVVLDKGFVGGGQTGQCCGFVRTFYNSRVMAYMAKESMGCIKELCSKEASLKYETKGLLVIDSLEKSKSMRQNVEMLQSIGIRAKYLEGEEISSIHPLVNTNNACAVFDEDAGYVNPQKIANLLAELCRREGVTIFEDTEVQDIKKTSEGFKVSAPGKTFFADKLFNATAAYSNSINALLGVKLEVKAISINNAFYRVPLVPSQTLVAIADFVNLFYIIPHESFIDVSTIVLDPTKEVDPPTYKYDFSSKIITDYLEDISKRIPALQKSSSLGGFNSCIDITPDYYPILSKIDIVPGYYCATGFSGTGFKHFPMIGRLMADLIAGGQPQLLESFRYNRFDGGKTREGVSDSYFVRG